jgi:hypothetical protein
MIYESSKLALLDEQELHHLTMSLLRIYEHQVCVQYAMLSPSTLQIPDSAM